MLVPATTGLGGVTVLLIARSAEAKKLTLLVAELSPLTGSGVMLLTVAVSLISPGSLLVKATWIVVSPPATTVRRLHLTVADIGEPMEVVQDAPVTDVTVKLALLTMMSVTTPFCAFDTPRLATWMSQKAAVPACAGASGLHVFVSAMSADSVTNVLAEAVLLLKWGSNWWALTVAVFAMFVALAPRLESKLAETITVMVNEMLAPFARFPMVHVTPAVQEIELVKNVVPPGSVSVTTTSVASEGPLLVTVSEYVSCPPANTEPGVVFVMARSAGLHVGKPTAPTWVC
jgi:hypothetical protein